MTKYLKYKTHAPNKKFKLPVRKPIAIINTSSKLELLILLLLFLDVPLWQKPLQKGQRWTGGPML